MSGQTHARVRFPSLRIRTLYASPKVVSKIEEIIVEKSIAEVLEAVYEQGMKDGRKEVIEKLDLMKAEINYLPPGRPKTRKKRK